MMMMITYINDGDDWVDLQYNTNNWQKKERE